MGYLCYRASGGVVSLSGTKYTGLDSYGTRHLCLRTGTSANDVVRYGLTTNTSVTDLKMSLSGKKVGIANRFTTTASYSTTTSVSSSVSTSQQSISQYSSSNPRVSGASTWKSLGATSSSSFTTGNSYGTSSSFPFGSSVQNLETYSGGVSTLFSNKTSTLCGNGATYTHISRYTSGLTLMTNKYVMSGSTSGASQLFTVKSSSAVTSVGPFGGQYGRASVSVMAPFRYINGFSVTSSTRRADSDDDDDWYNFTFRGSRCTLITLYSGWYFATATGSYSTTATRTTSMKTTISSSTASSTSRSTGTTAHNVNV